MLLSPFSPLFVALALFTSLYCAHSFRYSCVAFVFLCSIVLAMLHLQHLHLHVMFTMLHLQCLCLWCYARGASFSMLPFAVLCSQCFIFDTCIWFLINIWSLVSFFFKHMLFKNFHHFLLTIFFLCKCFHLQQKRSSCICCCLFVSFILLVLIHHGQSKWLFFFTVHCFAN